MNYLPDVTRWSLAKPECGPMIRGPGMCPRCGSPRWLPIRYDDPAFANSPYYQTLVDELKRQPPNSSQGDLFAPYKPTAPIGSAWTAGDRTESALKWPRGLQKMPDTDLTGSQPW